MYKSQNEIMTLVYTVNEPSIIDDEFLSARSTLSGFHTVIYFYPIPLHFSAFLCLTTPCRCSCSFPGLEATPGVSHQSLIATAAVQILLSVVLTTALAVRFLLWCRGERRQGLTLICSPIVSCSHLCLYHNVTVLEYAELNLMGGGSCKSHGWYVTLLVPLFVALFLEYMFP